MDNKSILALIRSTPPRCLRRFRAVLVPAAKSRDLVTAWKLVCRCGSAEGAVLGHPLGDLKPGFEEVPLFVSPLSFRCARCGAVTKLLDTDADGTGAELARLNGSAIGCAAYRGRGRKKPYPCRRCGVSRGEVVVTLWYNEDYIYDLEDDGIEFPFENLFSGVHAHSRCSECGMVSQVTDIDTKY